MAQVNEDSDKERREMTRTMGNGRGSVKVKSLWSNVNSRVAVGGDGSCGLRRS